MTMMGARKWRCRSICRDNKKCLEGRLFEEKLCHYGQVVADASMIDGTQIVSMRFHIAMSGVWFCEDG